jgi:FMN phosphatase YigB (HAD superfamily)
MRKFAIFDIDGTIFRSSLLIELTDSFIQEGVFPENARKVYARSFKDWLDRKDTYDKYIGRVVGI